MKRDDQGVRGSAAVWDFTGRQQRERLAAASRKNRIGGLIRGVVGAAIGTLFYLFLSRTVAYVVFGISGFSTLLALASPLVGYRYLNIAIGWVGRFLGTVMAVICLAPLYYLFFAPFRLLFRRGRRDQLCRTFPSDEASYWVDRSDEEPDASAYERQF